jgi:hypothetical protein
LSKAAFALLTAAASPTFSQEVLGEYEEQVIHYETGAPLRDPVAQLQQKLDRGSTRLKFEGERGFLPDVLKALRVPVSSQTLVFSKTSSQRAHTSPHTPRALYFNDEVSVGWAPGNEVIDLAAMDPERGTLFYTLDQSSNAPPRFARRNDCMQCHIGPKTMNVPGWLVRSVYTDVSGKPLGNVEGFVGGHNSPIETRWAGWYVTGNAGSARHLGNLFAKNVNAIEPSVSVTPLDLLELARVFDTRPYPSSGSDVVALLVLEHELRMQNLITYANYETRYALAEWAQSEKGRGTEGASWHNDWSADILVRSELKLHRVQSMRPGPMSLRTGMSALRFGIEMPPGADGLQLCSVMLPEPGDPHAAPAGSSGRSDWPRQRIALAGEMLLEYMLFRNEAPLKGPITGSSDFAGQFQAMGPRTTDGRSLRDFDLHTRLFKYPCSFLIYSPAFDALLPPMKEYLWQRLARILTGRERTGVYASMPDADRRNILEILRETKPEFAQWLEFGISARSRSEGNRATERASRLTLRSLRFLLLISSFVNSGIKSYLVPAN